ncbi:MAG: hypothetical protein V1889_00250 [archaeon]
MVNFGDVVFYVGTPALCASMAIGTSLFCMYEWGRDKNGPFKSGRDAMGFAWDVVSKVGISDLRHLVEEDFIERNYLSIYQSRFRNAQPLLF